MSFDESRSASSHSITLLIRKLKEQDQLAAEQIWRRYFQRLLPLARSRLKALPHCAVDEEDVLVSVFDRFFRAANEDRFARLEDRDDLWQVLFMLTERKVADQYRRSTAQKRGGGEVANEAQLSQLNLAEIRELADREPDPQFIAAFNDNLAQAVNRLDRQKTREVALLKLEGHTNREIAQRLDIGLSTVERKLRVIRELWEEVFAQEQ